MPGKTLKFLTALLLFIHLNLNGQEQLAPLPNNDRLRVTLFEKAAASARLTPLELPFVDDFNQKEPYPNPNLWEDRFVFINNTYPDKPPTLGVATFDGLNPLGQPYSLNINAVGIADQLTSLPINLSGLTNADNIFLSFYWQAGGLGERPEPGRDYLKVEFQDNKGEWIEQLRITPPADSQPFEQRFIQLIDPFLYDTFRFRFTAVGNLSGNTDHWHIDYVILDKNRNPATERSVADLAYVKGPERFFKDYYQLPYKHFRAEMLNNAMNVSVKNNFQNTVDIVDNYIAVERGTGDVLDTYSGPSEDIGPVSLFNYNYKGLTIPEGLGGDTVIIDVRYFFNTSAENNSPEYVRANNELKQEIFFSNIFSYDDGSAERVYRLVNFDFGKIAAGFRTTVPDTLRAIRIHFPNFPNYTLPNTTNPLFNLVVWSSIDTIGGSGGKELFRENLLKKSDFIKPFGDEVNDFAYYTFNKELNDGKDYLLVDGNFFIGIEFEKGNGVDIGFDINTNGNKHLFYDIGNGWFQSTFSGSAMINPIMGSALSGIYTPVLDRSLRPATIKVFPNPTSASIFIQPDIIEPYQYDILNICGQVLKTGRASGLEQISVGDLQPGMYLVIIQDWEGRFTGRGKFIKQ
jgi:hypothetical protein